MNESLPVGEGRDQCGRRSAVLLGKTPGCAVGAELMDSGTLGPHLSSAVAVRIDDKASLSSIPSDQVDVGWKKHGLLAHEAFSVLARGFVVANPLLHGAKSRFGQRCQNASDKCWSSTPWLRGKFASWSSPCAWNPRHLPCISLCGRLVLRLACWRPLWEGTDVAIGEQGSPHPQARSAVETTMGLIDRATSIVVPRWW